MGGPQSCEPAHHQRAQAVKPTSLRLSSRVGVTVLLGIGSLLYVLNDGGTTYLYFNGVGYCSEVWAWGWLPSG